LEEKIPDIRKTLDMVEYLQEKEEDIDDLTDAEDTLPKPLKKTTFELNDTLFAEAELDDSDTVFLWLGVRFFFKALFNPPTF
jgi:hypothetical protein